MRDSKGSSIYIHLNQSSGAERGEIQETKLSPSLLTQFGHWAAPSTATSACDDK